MIGQEFSYPIQQSIYIADGIDNLFSNRWTLFYCYYYAISTMPPHTPTRRKLTRDQKASNYHSTRHWYVICGHCKSSTNDRTSSPICSPSRPSNTIQSITTRGHSEPSRSGSRATEMSRKRNCSNAVGRFPVPPASVIIVPRQSCVSRARTPSMRRPWVVGWLHTA